MKTRNGFVTNSSSSSFILAFKNKKDAYSAVCEAFLKTIKEDDEYEYEYEYDDSSCALDNVILAMEGNKKSAEEIINFYLEEISWYPVRHKIEREFWNNEEKYPREDSKDFRAKYDAIIDTKRDEELAKIKIEMEGWLKDKKYIAKVDFEDHWPESKSHDVCASISEKNMKQTRN